MSTDRNHSQSLGWLVAGLFLGLLLVLISVLTPTIERPADADVVATVNGVEIKRAKYLSYLQSLSDVGRKTIRPEHSEHVLQRMIEEELLVQRGVEVGLLENDKRSRAAMVNAMISMTTASAEAKAPSEEDLSLFFEENPGYFQTTSRLRVRQLVIRGASSEEHAQLARQQLLAGDDFYAVEREFGNPVALSIPDRLLPPAKLREYLGPTLTLALMQQGNGYVSEPQVADDGFRIVQLVEHDIGQVPEMDAIRQQLEAEYVRREGEKALRQYLDWLRQRADISYPDETVAADRPRT